MTLEQYKANPNWEEVAYYLYRDEGYTAMLGKIAQSVSEDRMQEVQIIVNSAIEEWARAQVS